MRGAPDFVGVPRPRRRARSKPSLPFLCAAHRPWRGRWRAVVALPGRLSSSVARAPSRCHCPPSALLAVRGEDAARGGFYSPWRSSPLAARVQCTAVVFLDVPLLRWRGHGPRRRLFSSAPLAVGSGGKARGSTCSSHWCPSPSTARAGRAAVVLSSAILAVRGEGTGTRSACSRGRPLPSTVRAQHAAVVFSLESLAVVGEGEARGSCSFSWRPSPSAARARARGQDAALLLAPGRPAAGPPGGATERRQRVQWGRRTCGC